MISSTARRLAVLATLAVVCSGCYGEDNAIFIGTVVEGPAGHSFDEWPNPKDRPPIEGATVDRAWKSAIRT